MKNLHYLVLIIFSFFSLSSFAQQASFKTYINYDFVPGEKILFEDHFLDSPIGEFPARWTRKSGHGEVTNFDDATAFELTDGNYAKVVPYFKDENFLADSFTIEFDFEIKDGAYPLAVFFPNENGSERLFLWSTNVETGYFTSHLAGKYPDDPGQFYNQWHHAALSCENGQVKCYIDQYMLLSIPRFGFVPTKVFFGGIAAPEYPLLFTNVRITSGGGADISDKLTSCGRWIARGITFDATKTLKPESMGTMNAIMKTLNDNPGLRVEIGGYMDSDGGKSANMKLSYERAAVVKTLLVSKGIDDYRLMAKGYGENNPIDSNDTPEGKANNQRIELKLVK
ncbi:MAG: OmpA family protein [Saprospiraceae bacterium]